MERLIRNENEAIECLKKNKPTSGFYMLQESVDMAINALEKQIAKKVDEHNFQDEPHHYLCPDCRNIVGDNQNYCEECGQKLDWE